MQDAVLELEGRRVPCRVMSDEVGPAAVDLYLEEVRDQTRDGPGQQIPDSLRHGGAGSPHRSLIILEGPAS
jgi:hypothetical protein